MATEAKLASILRSLLAQQRREAELQIRAGREVDLSAWLEPMFRQLLPIIVELYRRSGAQALRQLTSIAATASGGKAWLHRSGICAGVKNIPAPGPGFIGPFGFDVFNPRILDAIRDAVFVLCRATLETSILQANEAVDATRAALAEGLKAGEAYKQLAERLTAIFDDPQRASVIAQTEATRAAHGGQVLAAKESGIVKGKRWLASTDACSICLKLNGKEVGLDEPFYVWPRGGPYATVMHPPAHPGCMCAMQDVLDPDIIAS